MSIDKVDCIQKYYQKCQRLHFPKSPNTTNRTAQRLELTGSYKQEEG